ncbi:MAG: nitrilase-related carbon-nitrogen hydrolase [Deltaproteobacteria bacterium]
MKVACIQTSPVFGAIKKNVDDAVKKISRIDADLVVLPELFSTGYQFRDKKEALSYGEDVRTGYASTMLAGLAKKKKMHIVAGINERAGKKVYNSAVLVGPNGLCGLYRKGHLFWNEKKIFSPGDTELNVYDIGKAKIGLMVCFDWIFPEVARTLALRGADILCQPSNLVLPYCPQAMITRSIENRVYSIVANRVGTEERIKGSRLDFIGQSEVVAPDGEVLWRAGGKRTASKVVDIDPRLARNKSINPLNNLFKDRREDLFAL